MVKESLAKHSNLLPILDSKVSSSKNIEAEFSTQSQVKLLADHYPQTCNAEIITKDLSSSDWIVVKNNRQQFMVAFNPESDTWIKIAMEKALDERLREGQKALKSSLGLSNIDATQTSLKPIVLEGKKLLASQVPHLGISIAHLIKADLIDQESISKLYQQAHQKACQLADQGWLFADPNPGNIVVRNLSKPSIVLIDFDNRRIKTNPGLSKQDTEYLEGKFFKQIKRNNIPLDKKELSHISNQSLLKLGTIDQREFDELTFYLFHGDRS